MIENKTNWCSENWVHRPNISFRNRLSLSIFTLRFWFRGYSSISPIKFGKTSSEFPEIGWSHLSDVSRFWDLHCLPASRKVSFINFFQVPHKETSQGCNFGVGFFALFSEGFGRFGRKVKNYPAKHTKRFAWSFGLSVYLSTLLPCIWGFRFLMNSSQIISWNAKDSGMPLLSENFFLAPQMGKLFRSPD